MARWRGTPHEAAVRDALDSAGRTMLNRLARVLIDRNLRGYAEDLHEALGEIFPGYRPHMLVDEYGNSPDDEDCDEQCSGCNWCSECDEYHGDPDVSSCCSYCGVCDRHDWGADTDSDDVCDKGHCHECEHHCESV